MAWVTHGSILNIQTLENKSYPEYNSKKTITVTANCNDTDCLALMLTYNGTSNDNAVYYQYELRVYKQKKVQFSKSGNAQSTTVTEYPNDPSTEPTTDIKRNNNFDKMGAYLKGNQINTNNSAVYGLSSSIPIFNDNDALKKYITTGDTSGAVIDASTK